MNPNENCAQGDRLNHSASCGLPRESGRTIQDFSRRLFWDVNPASLDIDRDKKYVIARVLEFGSLQDWQRLVAHFSLDVIIAEAKTFRTLDAKALSFLCVVGHTPKESFRCCALKQLNPTLWNS